MLTITLHLHSESRADLALLDALKASGAFVSRSTLKSYFKDRLIIYKEKPLSASYIFPKGFFEVNYPKDLLNQNHLAKASIHGCFLDILYEDENLLVLNKKSGVPTLPHTSSETETAVGAALFHTPLISNVGKGGLDPGLLHRLDTGTSGALAFAKNNTEFTRLRSLWSTGSVLKTYRTWISSKNKEELFNIPNSFEFQIGHDPKNQRKMKVITSDEEKIRGKSQTTKTDIISILNHENENKYTELEIRIQTGVMHQIRCTLAHLGWPVLGDPIYKGVPASRLMLHAWKLEIPLVNGEYIKVVAPLDSSWIL